MSRDDWERCSGEVISRRVIHRIAKLRSVAEGHISDPEQDSGILLTTDLESESRPSLPGFGRGQKPRLPYYPQLDGNPGVGETCEGEEENGFPSQERSDEGIASLCQCRRLGRSSLPASRESADSLASQPGAAVAARSLEKPELGLWR
ncbi:MAG: hypothetical protein Q9217_004683 [Psora testacea]